MTANPIHDQIDAAANDAAHRLVTLGEQNENYSVRDFGPVAKEIMHRWFEEAGDSSQQAMCSHVSDAPQVVFSAAAFPGVVTCADCFTHMWRNYVGLLNRMNRGRPCDGCHQFVPEGKTGVMSVGPMLMTVSMCGVCCVIDDAGAP